MISSERDDTGTSPPLVDPEAIVASTLDADYLQSQIEPNIEHTYAYLHGDTDELTMTVDLVPVKDGLTAAIEAELHDADTVALLGMAAGEDADLTVDTAGFSVDFLQVAEMARSESTFHAEREAFRGAVRAEVVGMLVVEQVDAMTVDEQLDLVIESYDPDDYTQAEKEQLLADHEDGIHTVVREHIETEDEGEITAAVDTRLAETRERMRANSSAAMEAGLDDLDPEVQAAAQALLVVAVDGYTADMTHAEFEAEYEGAADALAAVVADMLKQELDGEVPDRVDLADELDPATAEDLDAARDAIVWLDRLALLLPAIGFGLVGALYLATRTLAVTAIGAGVGMVGGGLPGLVGALALRDPLRELLASAEGPTALGDLLSILAIQVADTIAIQSGALVGLGMVALAAGLALYFDVITYPSLTGDR